jgi:photosystem II stability/assembly factor-like uncharacterized protein
MIKQFFSIIALLTLALSAYNLQAQTVVQLQKSQPTSIRGMSVINDQVAWVSGSKGYVGLTLDGGQTWHWRQVAGFEKSDFRAIDAFSGKEAIIMSSGTPAVIMKTIDGGASWQTRYRATDSAYFLDAMDFANKKHGFVLGDPMNNKFLVLETNDGGESWAMLKNAPDALPREAAFAASGTCLRVGKHTVTVVSGGNQTRMLTYLENEDKWDYQALPVKHGKQSQGTFSVAASANGSDKIFVGGDYSHDNKTDSVACYSSRADSALTLPEQGPAGYQSCVEYISGQTFLSTGTPGSNITTDGGKTWKKIDGASYNVCRKAKNGKLVLLAGNNGAIGLLKL